MNVQRRGWQSLARSHSAAHSGTASLLEVWPNQSSELAPFAWLAACNYKACPSAEPRHRPWVLRQLAGHSSARQEVDRPRLGQGLNSSARFVRCRFSAELLPNRFHKQAQPLEPSAADSSQWAHLRSRQNYGQNYIQNYIQN